jgi:hypothetical protein
MPTNTDITNQKINSIFTHQMEPRDVTGYMLSRGVADYSNLYQWNNFETGYAFLFLLKIPDFLDKLRNKNTQYANLINSYCHILEYDFRSLDGLDNMTVETGDLNDGINTLPIITRVTEQAGSAFSMRYYERSGSIITKTHELFLRGVKDPRTQVKRYHGLIQPDTVSNPNGRLKSELEAGYEHETFEFLYFVTDNTATQIEKAYLLVSCQPTDANLQMYNYTKGEIAWSEVSVNFNGYPITGPGVTKKAKDFLAWVNERTIFDETRFGYKALSEMPAPGQHNVRADVHPESPEAEW